MYTEIGVGVRVCVQCSVESAEFRYVRLYRACDVTVGERAHTRKCRGLDLVEETDCRVW